MIALEPGERLVVIGLNVVEALHWARHEGYNPLQIITVSDVRQLFGLPQGMKYVLVGQWAYRRDWPELDAALRTRQARQMW
jgi:hypothetical protein